MDHCQSYWMGRGVTLYLHLWSVSVFSHIYDCSFSPNKDFVVCTQSEYLSLGKFCLLRACREGVFSFPRFLGGDSSWFSYLSEGPLAILNHVLFAAVNHLAEGLCI